MPRTLCAALDEAAALIGRVDARVLVAHLLGVDRAYLVAHPMRLLTEAEDAKVDLFVAQRALGRPVAYLTGNREFYGREFAVTPDVLIPRPETETLVEAALARLDAASGPAHAPGSAIECLDLGTGSGAVGITLACERPAVRVTATDVSEAALRLARLNARRLGCEARAEFLRGEWYAPVDGRSFDLIVANPPYVARDDRHLAQGDLRFEPVAALTDGSADGLASIAAIVRGAAQRLRPGGWLLLEHGYDQREAVAGLLEACGFADLVSAADLAGIPRVAGGRLE